MSVAGADGLLRNTYRLNTHARSIELQVISATTLRTVGGHYGNPLSTFGILPLEHTKLYKCELLVVG